jgi:hypothetical protein
MPTPQSSEEPNKGSNPERAVVDESEVEFCLILAKLFDEEDMTCPSHEHEVT